MKLSELQPPSDNAPGWKPDPLGGTLYRYWDGSRWTSNVDPAPSSDDPYTRCDPADAARRYPPLEKSRAPQSGSLGTQERVEWTPQKPPEPRKSLEAEGRIRRSWRLTKIAWGLVRSSRSCLVLAVLGLGFTTLATGLILLLGGYFESPREDTVRLALVGGAGLYLTTLIGAFFNVALAKAASAALQGKSISVGEVIAASRRRLRQIVIWSLVAATVGLILDQLARRVPWGAKIATWLVGAAWGLATMFVIPILADEEDAEALPSIRRSARVLRERWSEGLTGSLVIGAWAILVYIPLVVIFCVASRAAADDGTGTFVAVFGVEVVAFVLVGAVLAALRQVFTVVLYQYAVAGPTGNFPLADLESPFTKRKTAGQQAMSTLKWIGISVGALLLFVIVVGSIVGPPESHYRDSRSGYFNHSFPLSVSDQTHRGTAVTYRGHWVGRVVDRSEEDGELFVVYHLRKDLRALGYRSVNERLEGAPGDRHLTFDLGSWTQSGYAHTVMSPRYAHAIHDTMPVVNAGRKVGEVSDHFLGHGRLQVLLWLKDRFLIEAKGRDETLYLRGRPGNRSLNWVFR